MTWNIFKFECRYQLRQPTFWVSATIFFLLAFFATISDNVRIGDTASNIFVNAPYTIFITNFIFSIIAIFFAASFIASTVIRDFENKSAEILYSTPMSKFSYLYGRFSGGWIMSVAAFAMVSLGILLGSIWPTLDPETVGPFTVAPYLQSLFLIILPNLFISGSIVFFLSTMTRSLMATYLGLLVLFIIYFVGQTFLDNPELRTIAALSDPFGLSAFGDMSRYWTPHEKNHSLMSLSKIFLMNRLIWIFFCSILLGLTSYLFPMTAIKKTKIKKASSKDEQKPSFKTNFSDIDKGNQPLKQFITRVTFETLSVFKSIPFIVLLFMTILQVAGLIYAQRSFLDADIYPLTRIMTEVVNNASNLYLLIVLIYYAAEISWRERKAHIHEIIDATPAPNWTFSLAKVFSVLLVIGSTMMVGIATTIVYQLVKGVTNLELGLYFTNTLLIGGFRLYLLALLAMFIQQFVKNQFIGMIIIVAYFIFNVMISNLGFQDGLYRLGFTKSIPYSDINGYGHFFSHSKWFFFYWSSFAGLLIAVTMALYRRGTSFSLVNRLKLAWLNQSLASKSLVSLFLIGMISSGAYIFHNTHVVNEFRSSEEKLDLSAAYEKEFIKFKDLAQPKVTKVYTEVNLFPHQQRAEIDGTLTLVNKWDKEIQSLHITIPKKITVHELRLSRTTTKEIPNEKFRHYIYHFEEPLQPQSSLTLNFSVTYGRKGFSNSSIETAVVDNGSFLHSYKFLPGIGYNKSWEVSDPKDRRDRDLPKTTPLPPLESTKDYQNHYIGDDADWVDFETVVSTVEDQTAIAPGYLQKEWTDNGRKYFHYKMDAPILYFFAYLSARFEVAKEMHHGISLEIYYHKGHDYNLSNMFDSMKASIDYFSEQFSPYQHRQARIIEFPAYASLAQSLPNTIPYSESIGFIADLRDKEAIDFVYYVTAHELAHQWWGHQLVGANVQGATLLSESLSQYSALMVMEKTYGEYQIRKFLKFELDRYLRSRGNESRKELPIGRNENQQYIHYRKGSLVLYALKDYIGEEKLNRALNKFVEQYKFRGPPYPTSKDLIKYIREEASAEHQDIITDLFENITLYDLKAKKVTLTKQEDGKFAIEFKIETVKLYADEHGMESSSPLDELIDIGVFTKHPKEIKSKDDVLYLAKHRIQGDDNIIRLVLDKEPKYIGIDPYNKLVDRDSDDNIKIIN